jgi:alkylhydroperoxidase family enzyme
MEIMPRNSKQHRIEPLEPPYDAGAAAALELLGPPIALFRTWARRPDLARGIAGWGRYYLSRQSALTLRQRELAIDRTTALCGADYEWGVHIAFFAERAALTADQVTSLGTGRPADRAVLRAVDELHTSHDLADATWDGLVDAAGADGALDLLLLCGWYHAISFTVRSLRLPLEPGTAPIRSANDREDHGRRTDREHEVDQEFVGAKADALDDAPGRDRARHQGPADHDPAEDGGPGQRAGRAERGQLSPVEQQ